jgi:uncharacterized membrane protein
MISPSHVRHHGPFYVAILAGILVWVVAWRLGWAIPPVLGGDAFFIIYLASAAAMRVRMSPDDLRGHASEEDEGILVIVLLAVAAIVFSLTAIFALLNRGGQPGTWQLICAIASVPLGWLTLHTIAAFHYAHLYYAQSDERLADKRPADERPSEGQTADASRRDAGGLKFPGDAAPDAWDLLYYSFVVGMTAQVSDVAVLNRGMRRFTLAHGVLSFFYNTVLIALAVNVAIAQGR